MSSVTPRYRQQYLFCSSNHLEVCAALVAITKLVTEDMIPAVQGEVRSSIHSGIEVLMKGGW